ncbi:MAG TPA: hypothetical protein VHJ58_11100 [Vicinamibacterales bacterium]|nr:hypothetical protein [Vicinamibacterales bacterium]
MAQVVDPSMGNARSAKPRCPLAVTVLFKIDVAASGGRKQQWGIQTRREGVENV